MRALRLSLQAAGLMLLAFSAAACFRVHVIEDCRDADARFQRAYREISGLHARNPERRGRAHEVCILAYDRDRGELVHVQTSLWLAKAALSLGRDIAADKADYDFEERYGLAWRQVTDLGRFGPGLLVEVEDEESRVLVWMK